LKINQLSPMKPWPDFPDPFRSSGRYLPLPLHRLTVARPHRSVTSCTMTEPRLKVME